MKQGNQESLLSLDFILQKLMVGVLLYCEIIELQLDGRGSGPSIWSSIMLFKDLRPIILSKGTPVFPRARMRSLHLFTNSTFTSGGLGVGVGKAVVVEFHLPDYL